MSDGPAKQERRKRACLSPQNTISQNQRRKQDQPLGKANVTLLEINPPKFGSTIKNMFPIESKHRTQRQTAICRMHASDEIVKQNNRDNPQVIHSLDTTEITAMQFLVS
jgi:hypothetical protein